MVSTRNHPKELPPPELSPAKPSSHASTPSSRKSRKSASPTSSSAPSAQPAPWAHRTTPLTLFWLAFSLPLVAWDVGYVLLRPHSMPGGSLHSPLWTPYAIYSEVDKIYGFEALEAHDGFTAAQSWMNVVESLIYLSYLSVVMLHGRNADSGEEAALATNWWNKTWFGQTKLVEGFYAPRAAMIGFAGALMTFSKTMLYGENAWQCGAVRYVQIIDIGIALNEYCSGFHHIGHNSAFLIFWVYIIPKRVLNHVSFNR